MEQFQNSCFLAINLVDVIAFAEDVSSYFPHGLARYLREFVSAVFFLKQIQWNLCRNACHISTKDRQSCMPIGSMYGIYANIWGILMVNVIIYIIHGSYGMGQPSRTDFSCCHLFGSQPAVAEHPPRFGDRATAGGSRGRWHRMGVGNDAESYGGARQISRIY